MTGSIMSEIRKVFTTKMWWGIAIGMAVLAALLSMAMSSLVGIEGGPPDLIPSFAQLVYNAGLLGNFGSLTALFPLALGVLLVTNESRHQTVTATYLATPRRWVVAVAKIVAVAIVGVIYGVVHVIASVVGGVVVLGTFKDVSSLQLGDPDVIRSLGIAVLATVIWTLLGYGFGQLVRNQVAALLLAIGVAFLGQIFLNIVFAILGWETPGKFLPGNLTTGMLVTGDPFAGTTDASTDGESYFFSWWLSALILIGYSAALTVIGSIFTARRDIS